MVTTQKTRADLKAPRARQSTRVCLERPSHPRDHKSPAEVLLVLEPKEIFKDGAWTTVLSWALPGGERQGDETLHACGVREVREELDLDISGVPVCFNKMFSRRLQPGSRSGHSVSRTLLLAYRTQILGTPAVKEPLKKAQWFKAEDLPVSDPVDGAFITPNTAEYLREIFGIHMPSGRRLCSVKGERRTELVHCY